MWSDIEHIEPPVVVPVKQPEQLKLQLLPFQKYGVGWMIQQEKVEAVKYFFSFFDFLLDLLTFSFIIKV